MRIAVAPERIGVGKPRADEQRPRADATVEPAALSDAQRLVIAWRVAFAWRLSRSGDPRGALPLAGGELRPSARIRSHRRSAGDGRT